MIIKKLILTLLVKLFKKLALLNNSLNYLYFLILGIIDIDNYLNYSSVKLIKLIMNNLCILFKLYLKFIQMILDLFINYYLEKRNLR